jgi:hypothetical protein
MKSQRRGFLKAMLGAPMSAAVKLEAAPEPQRPKCPPFTPHQVFRIKSSKTGKPEMAMISSYSEQVDFCRAEGLINPNTSVSFNALGEMVINPRPDHGPLVFPNGDTDGGNAKGTGGYVKPPEPTYEDEDRWWED